MAAEIFSIKGEVDVDIKKGADNLEEISEKAQDTAGDLEETGKAGEEAGERGSAGLEKFKKAAGLLGKAVAAGLAAAGAAVVKLTTQAVSTYADYEQLVGGVETLFGDAKISFEDFAAQAENTGLSLAQLREEYDNLNSAQDVVLENAANAYKTAGLSANEYMETVTGFSAALISSLGGDTMAAAEKANLAITDMSDNANKMGSSMESIQNAYAGFAKQNYTMLDNLKLGYGGTAEEMQRLLNDAEKLSGVKYDISSYADIVDAIHVVQTEMGITGTTAKEAATTISGSIGMTKSAWANLVGGLADENADLKGLVGDLISSVTAAASNLLPVIGTALNGIADLIQKLAPKIVEILPGLVSDILPTLLNAVLSIVQAVVAILPDTLSTIIKQISEVLLPGLFAMIPDLLNAGVDLLIALLDGLSSALPQIIAFLPTLISTIVDFIKNNLGEILAAGIELIVALAQGLADALPDLAAQIPEIVATIYEVLISNLPVILQAAWQIILALIQGIIKSIPQLASYMPKVILGICTGLTNALGKMLEMGKTVINTFKNGIKSKIEDAKTWGKDLIANFINGIKQKFQALKDSVSNVASTVKSFLGFSEPEEGPLSNFHTYAPDMMDLYAEGIEDNAGKVTKAIKSSFDLQPVINAAVIGSTNAINGPAQLAASVSTASTNAAGNGSSGEIIAVYFDRLLGAIEKYMPEVIDNMQRDFVFDDGTVAAKLAPAIDAQLGLINRQKARGL